MIYGIAAVALAAGYLHAASVCAQVVFSTITQPRSRASFLMR